MSKIGKKIIEVPATVQLKSEGNVISVTGPKGNLAVNHEGRVIVTYEDGKVTVAPNGEKNFQYWGLYRTIINNLLNGVSNGVEKKLEFHGIGYRASVQNGDLVLSVGYSHPVVVKKIDGVQYTVTENVITVSGIDKVLVGDIAAKIRAVRVPNPYKGKGIRYQGETIIKKETKSA